MDINTITAKPIFMLAVFSFGACIGSFLNVCIYRIPNKKSIVFPGSFCTSCKTHIPFYLNIPIISYIVLMGKCRYCKSKIPLRYPFIEALTGFTSLAVILKFGLSPAAFFWFVFICVLITISFIDIDFQIIPDVISLPGIIIFAFSPFFLPEMSIMDTITGIIAGGGSLYLIALLYYLLKKQEGMGGGDIKLLAMIGAATGWKGILFTTFVGSLLGTVAGIFILIITKTGNIKLKIPFGPYLSSGVVIYIFFGKQIIHWYLNLNI